MSDLSEGIVFIQLYASQTASSRPTVTTNWSENQGRKLRQYL